MSTIAYALVKIQTAVQPVPSIPDWFGEITLLSHHLNRQKTLERISEQVCFARRRFGRYEVIDFLAVLFGYAVSGEHTLEAFYQRLHPWANAFMVLFGRERLPARSTLSRFLAALDQATVESLRTLFCKICWLVRWCKGKNQADSGIGREPTSSSSTSMGHARQPGNEPCR